MKKKCEVFDWIYYCIIFIDPKQNTAKLGHSMCVVHLRQNDITLYALHMWDARSRTGIPVYENQWRMVQLQGVITKTWLEL